MSESDAVFSSLEESNKKTFESLNRDLARVRAGKASPSLLDGLLVPCYGQTSPINQLAGITVPDARTIVIAPWDQSVLGEIEKAIQQSDLGLNPQNDGKVIRLNIPPLTEERRKELVKQVNKAGEEAKVGLRQHRKVANDEIKDLEKAKKISEDDSKRDQAKVQTVIDESVKKIDTIIEKKNADILTI